MATNNKPNVIHAIEGTSAFVEFLSMIRIILVVEVKVTNLFLGLMYESGLYLTHIRPNIPY